MLLPKLKKLLPVFLLLGYFGLGLVFLKDYGINWDEPDHFIRGQTFLNLFLGKRDYQNLPTLDLKTYRLNWGYSFTLPDGQIIRRSIYQYYPFSWYLKDLKTRAGHPAFTDILAAASNYIFFVKLGISPDVESYNFVPIFLSAVLVATTYVWVEKIFGSFAGLMAALSLALYPLFLGERHFNIKDVPQAVFFALALMAFFEAISRMSKKYLILFIVFASMAFATKLNFGFAVFIIFPWLFWYAWQQKKPRELFTQHKAFWLLFLTTPLFMISFMILTWPAIWYQPQLLKEIILYYGEIGTSLQNNINLYGLKYVVFKTPISTLFFTFLGFLVCFFNLRNKQRQALNLVLLWFLVPIVRVSLPRTNIYGGVRQIMEYIPAMAILAGIGAHTLSRILVKKTQVINFLKVIMIISFLPIIYRMFLDHPHECVYFNELIGGLAGAREANLPHAGQCLGNPYRQGINWINQNAEPNARLGFGYEMMANIPHIWVRNDIKFTNLIKSGPLKQGEYVISIIDEYNSRFNWYGMRYLQRIIQPVYEVKSEGVSLLKVWKNDEAHTRPDYQEEEQVFGVKMIESKSYVRIVLPELSLLSRLEFIIPEKNKANCLRLPDERGSFVLIFPGGTKPRVYLPAIHTDFNLKLKYPEPFFLFAGDEAEIADYHFSSEAKNCFKDVEGVKVFRFVRKNIRYE